MIGRPHRRGALSEKGKEAEKDVKTWLEARSVADAEFAWHRFPDAKAARGALAAQPSDFLVINKGVPTFLEIKETAEERRLPKDKVSQYGALLKFHWASADVIVLVRRTNFKDWIFFLASDLFVDRDRKSFPFESRLATKTYRSAAEALEEIFQ